MNSPFTFAVLKGKEMIELANDKIKVWEEDDIEGKSLLDIMHLKILHSTRGSTRFVPLVFLSWC
jgi:hypothetical protein